MNIATVKRRIEVLEDKRAGGRLHIITARDGDSETIDRLKLQHIEAGAAHEHDTFVVIRKFAAWPGEPSIHTSGAPKPYPETSA